MSGSLHHLWLYTDWANTLLLETLRGYSDAVPSICLRLLSHIMNAQVIWLSRINGVPSPVSVWTEHDLTTCEHYHRTASEELGQIVKAYVPEQNQLIDYKDSKNVAYQNSLQDILLHIFNHGSYHRAQIAMEMRRNGLEPINTDYLIFARNRERSV